MRIRTIKPEFFLHEGLVELEASSNLPVRLAFIGLWCIADREGRFKWEPRKLGVQVFPYEPVNFAAVLLALEKHGMIRRYGPAMEYGCIPSFLDHQCINTREAKSILPEYTETHMHARACTEITNEPEEVENPARGEGKGREGKGMEGVLAPSAEKTKAKASSPEEVELFCLSIGCTPGQGLALFWKMEGNGWSNGGRPVKNWQATARAWKVAGYLPVPLQANGAESTYIPQEAREFTQDDMIHSLGGDEECIERARRLRAKFAQPA